MDFETTEYTRIPFKFSGRSTEFFGIWVVNIALTILTLGVYSAWAKVRTNQYFYGNTILDGSAFQYLAQPMQILKGRMIASFVFAFYYFLNTVYPLWGLGLAAGVVVLIPAIIVLSMSFRMRNTAFRNVTFKFKRNFKHAYLIYGGPFLLMGLVTTIIVSMVYSEFSYLIEDGGSLSNEINQETDALLDNALPENALPENEMFDFPLAIFAIFPLMLLAIPFWEYLKTKFLVANSQYGTSDFDFEAGAGSFYKLYIGALVLFILVFIVFGFITAGIGFMGSDETEIASDATPLFVTLSIFPLYLWAFAYLQTKRANLIYNHTNIQGMQFESRLTVTYMFFLYFTNTLAIGLSLGLLIPWSMIRTARYRASTLTLLTTRNLDNFVATQQTSLSALGEEFGEVFDIDVGL